LDVTPSGGSGTPSDERPDDGSAPGGAGGDRLSGRLEGWLRKGGVTHVLEIFSCVVAVQLVFGREELWLPRRMKVHELGATFTGRAAPALVRRIRWFERFARPGCAV
jgi:hypothetical protein